MEDIPEEVETSKDEETMDEVKLANALGKAIRESLPQAVKDSDKVIHPPTKGWAYVSSLGLRILENQGISTVLVVAIMVWLGFEASPRLFSAVDNFLEAQAASDAAMLTAVNITNEKLDNANKVMAPLGEERKKHHEESKQLQQQQHSEIVTALSGMKDDIITAEVRDKLIAFAERWDDATREDFDKLMADVAELLKNAHSHIEEVP